MWCGNPNRPCPLVVAPFWPEVALSCCPLPSWYRMGTLTILCAAAWLKFAASNSAASCLFHLFLRFWNQILTCVSVKCRDAANPALSELLRYRFISKVDSNWKTWLRENTVRVFFLRHCILGSESSLGSWVVGVLQQSESWSWFKFESWFWLGSWSFLGSSDSLSSRVMSSSSLGSWFSLGDSGERWSETGDRSDTMGFSETVLLKWCPRAYGYHQAGALSRYCTGRESLFPGSSSRGKERSPTPSREKSAPSNPALDGARILLCFTASGLSSMLRRFLMEKGESLAEVWRVSGVSGSAITGGGAHPQTRGETRVTKM